MVQFEIDFTQCVVAGEDQQLEDTIVELEESIPALFTGCNLKRGSLEHPDAMGSALLPILQIVVGAPALIAIIREASKIIQAKIQKKSTLIFRRSLADGTLHEMHIESDQLNTDEGQKMLDSFFQVEGKI